MTGRARSVFEDLAAASAERDDLYGEISAAGDALAAMARKRNEQMDRAERAEAAVDRVRTYLADRPGVVSAADVLAVLDPT